MRMVHWLVQQPNQARVLLVVALLVQVAIIVQVQVKGFAIVWWLQHLLLVSWLSGVWHFISKSTRFQLFTISLHYVNLILFSLK